MLINYLDSLLLILNIQEQFIATVTEPRNVIENNKKILNYAEKLNVPIFISEQNPQTFSQTLNEIKEFSPNANIFQSQYFSAWKNHNLKKLIQAKNKKQIILTGLETHICILQTAFDLHNDGYNVFIVSNATSSATITDYNVAIQRFIANNLNVVTTEMLICEWITKPYPNLFENL